MNSNLQKTLELLNDEDSLVRGSTIECLMEVGGESYLENVLPLMDDEDELVRASVVEYIMEYGDSSFEETLTKYSKDSSSLVRADIYRAFGFLEIEGAVTFLKERLKCEESPMPRAALLESIIKLSGELAYRDELIKLFKADTGEEKCFMANSLVGIALYYEELVAEVMAVLQSELERVEWKGIRESIQKNIEILVREYNCQRKV